MYMKAAYQTAFGSLAAKRIFPLLQYVDFSVVFDGLSLGNVRIEEDNPDIIIDVDAGDGEVDMSVSDRGFALTHDGEWFFYENTIYHTSEEWREYFMPIYHALATEGRTQISFKGDNTILFATHVLPDIRSKHGVITRGIEDMIVDAKPTFEVYFDATQGGITAVVKANYGSIGLRLPNDVNGNGKIVVRDYEIENDLLSSFKMFNLQDGTFMLKSDREIYLFLSDEIPVLKEKAKLYYSDRFAGLKIMDRVDISASVTYNSGVDLLEADFESNLSYEQISGILSAVKLKKRFYRLSNGSFIDLENSKQKDIFNLLDQLDFLLKILKTVKKVIPKYHALYLNSLSSVEKNEEFKKYIEEIKI